MYSKQRLSMQLQAPPSPVMQEGKVRDEYEAAYRGYLGQLKNYVTNYHRANKRDALGATPLHYAALGGNLECVKYLLDLGAEVNYQDLRGASPLHNAAMKDHRLCALAMVEKGADVNLLDKTASSPLHYAALFSTATAPIAEKKTPRGFDGEPEERKDSELGMVELFIRKGALADVRCNGGGYPLHFAAGSGNLEGVRALIGAGARVNVTDYEGTTALHRAAVKSGACTNILLEEGANAFMRDVDGAYALHHAAEGGCVDALPVLVEKGRLPVNIMNEDNTTALHTAAFKGHYGCIEKLLQLGADPLITDAKGATPLHYLAYNGHEKCLGLFLKAVTIPQADFVNLKDKNGATALHKACFKGHTLMVEALRAAGADLLITDKEGAYPLHKAAFNGHTECVRYILDFGNIPNVNIKKASKKASMRVKKKDKNAQEGDAAAEGETYLDIDCTDNNNSTPLHKAALRGHIECLLLLLEKNANISLRDLQGSTALHNAVQSGTKECVEALLRKEAGEPLVQEPPPAPAAGSSTTLRGEQNKEKPKEIIAVDGVNQGDKNLMTPLHVAASIGVVPIARLLIARSAWIEAKTHLGRTPLFFAVRNGREDVARLLIIEGGASVNAMDNKTGRSIMDLQLHYPHALSAEVLTALVHERNNPVAERLDIEKLDPEKKQKLQEVIEAFNEKPKKGIEMLIKEKIVTDTPSAIAHFLFTCPKLDQNVVGDYISDLGDYAAAILAAYVRMFDFQDLDFDMAIRRFVGASFMLPKEAQKIDRVMQAFAKQYYEANPKTGVFVDEGAAYVLAFSVIMLNTDAHTDSIKDKMTCEQFLLSNRGMNGNKDFPKEFMVHLYKRIVEDEIKMKAERDKNVAWLNADKQGWLAQQGGRRKNWRNRWFVLKDASLYFFKKKTDPDPVGLIPLEGLRVSAEQGKGKHMYMLRIKHRNPAHPLKMLRYELKGKTTVTKQGSVELMMLSAPSKAEHTSWMHIIKKNIRRAQAAKEAAAAARAEESGNSRRGTGAGGVGGREKLVPSLSSSRRGVTIGTKKPGSAESTSALQQRPGTPTNPADRPSNLRARGRASSADKDPRKPAGRGNKPGSEDSSPKLAAGPIPVPQRPVRSATVNQNIGAAGAASPPPASSRIKSPLGAPQSQAESFHDGYPRAASTREKYNSADRAEPRKSPGTGGGGGTLTGTRDSGFKRTNSPASARDINLMLGNNRNSGGFPSTSPSNTNGDSFAASSPVIGLNNSGGQGSPSKNRYS